ncbi:MAG: YdbL family protein [Lentisphaeraceae bacterium]|nr:YdbL family protein [Lentisphaeraceae bacterium]
MKKAFFLITFLLIATSAMADMKQSLDSMKKRLPQIVALKKSQAIGEGNTGYAVALKDNAKAIVAAENGDRKVVYAEVAKKHGISVDQVGKQRAIQIHQKAAKGTMLQDGSGKWIEK